MSTATAPHTFPPEGDAAAPLDALARDLVGASCAPPLYVVCDGTGRAVLVATRYDLARDAYNGLPDDDEKTLEFTQYGVVASVEPESDAPGARLISYPAPRRFPA